MKAKTFTNCIYFLILLSITFAINYNVRAYNAVGGEFLLIPIAIALYYFYWLVRARWEETEEYFKGKDNV